MLTVQNRFSNYNQVFGKNMSDEEREYYETRSRIEEARDTIVDTFENAPKPVRNTANVFALGGTALLCGMSVGWGGKQSIKAIKNLLKTKSGQKFLAKTKSMYASVKNGLRIAKEYIVKKYHTGVEAFKKTKFYTKSNGKIDKFFKKNSFGKKLVKMKNRIKESRIYQKTTKFIRDSYEWVKKHLVSLKNRIKNIKGEQVEKATVNTLGVTGAASSGIHELQKSKKDNLDDEDYDALT